ncbi:MAG: Maf family protein [Phycisphaeraceae bacterium]
MRFDLPLILASQSPRRAQLLHEAGIAFEQRSPPFSDPDQPPGHLRGHEAEDYAEGLAAQKARSLTEHVAGPGTILAADTICVDDAGRLVGKPIDPADAEAMLRMFVNRDHRVITGVALLTIDADGGQTLDAFADAATVSFGPVDDAQLEAYLATDEWRGKAGGYNLFDRQRAGWPITVVGDPTTVVGLPMRRLGPVLDAKLHSGR